VLFDEAKSRARWIARTRNAPSYPVRLCPVCDAFELCGGRIGVLARGEHALREARFLLNYTQDVGGRDARRRPLR
jgi:hypothetical protein